MKGTSLGLVTEIEIFKKQFKSISNQKEECTISVCRKVPFSLFLLGVSELKMKKKKIKKKNKKRKTEDLNSKFQKKNKKKKEKKKEKIK